MKHCKISLHKVVKFKVYKNLKKKQHKASNKNGNKLIKIILYICENTSSQIVFFRGGANGNILEFLFIQK